MEIVTIDGKSYKRVLTDEGEYWDVKTLALNCGVHYDTIYYHLRTKKETFEGFIRSFEIISNDGKKRHQLFLQVPEGLDLIRMYVRALKTSDELKKIFQFIGKVRKGELLVAKKEDVEKLKEVQEKTHHLILGQDLSFILKRLDDIEILIKQNGIKGLPDHTHKDELMDTDRKKIIAWLFDNMEKDYGIPFYELWWQFSGTLGIDNYGKQPKSMFIDMLDFFYVQDRKLVVRAYNWYSSTANPQEDIKEVFLLIFEADKQKKLTEDDDTGVIV